jgi:hypothetical protein
MSTTRSIPYWTTSVFSSVDWFGSDLRIGHFSFTNDDSPTNLKRQLGTLLRNVSELPE